MSAKEEMQVAEEAVGAEVVVAAETVQRRGAFWQWPPGTKWRKNNNGLETAYSLQKENILFYQQSFEFDDGNVTHAFIGTDYVGGMDLPLKLSAYYVESSKMEKFELKYDIVTCNPLSYPTTADGFAIRIGDELNYNFPGRLPNEKAVRVRVLNHAYGVVVCVQNTRVRDRIMVVHSRDLRASTYWKD